MQNSDGNASRKCMKFGRVIVHFSDRRNPSHLAVTRPVAPELIIQVINIMDKDPDGTLAWTSNRLKIVVCSLKRGLNTIFYEWRNEA